MNYALSNKNDLRRLILLRRSMKKIFASLTLAALMLSGATAFAYTQTPPPSPTMTAKKKGKKKHKHHHSSASAATPKRK
jgi:hypothetical protein